MKLVQDYVKTVNYKLGEIDKLLKTPQEIYDSEYGDYTSLKILRCWIG